MPKEEKCRSEERRNAEKGFVWLHQGPRPSYSLLLSLCFRPFLFFGTLHRVSGQVLVFGLLVQWFVSTLQPSPAFIYIVADAAPQPQEIYAGCTDSWCCRICCMRLGEILKKGCVINMAVSRSF